MDVHTAVILAFDTQTRFRLLTLAQHNHQQTFLAGIDLPQMQRPRIVAAVRSNELYLDSDERMAVSHRVVPFFSDVAYLIDPSKKPWFWAIDETFGRNAGGEETHLRPVFIEPGHALANFAGLLAPPRKFLGMYTGQDGPPGYNYYAPPDYIALVNFAAMGFWKSGDLALLAELTPLIKNGTRSDWTTVVRLMRKRLAARLKEIVAR